jgi:hypothetical protein
METRWLKALSLCAQGGVHGGTYGKVGFLPNISSTSRSHMRMPISDPAAVLGQTHGVADARGVDRRTCVRSEAIHLNFAGGELLLRGMVTGGPRRADTRSHLQLQE